MYEEWKEEFKNMKKRILALACAMALMCAMSSTAFAAGSVTTESVTKSTAVVAADPALTIGSQQLTAKTIEEFAKTTTVAKAAVAEAKSVVGGNAFIASVIDLSVPAGTGEASFTLSCANIAAGQSVTILHQKADGTWEAITPSSVTNGSVTFTLTSYSPVAIVINATAPKTGDMAVIISMLAVVCLAGAVIFGRRTRLN